MVSGVWWRDCRARNSERRLAISERVKPAVRRASKPWGAAGVVVVVFVRVIGDVGCGGPEKSVVGDEDEPIPASSSVDAPPILDLMIPLPFPFPLFFSTNPALNFSACTLSSSIS